MKLKKKDIKALKRIKKFCNKQIDCENCPLLNSTKRYCSFELNPPGDLKIKDLTNN